MSSKEVIDINAEDKQEAVEESPQTEEVKAEVIENTNEIENIPAIEEATENRKQKQRLNQKHQVK